MREDSAAVRAARDPTVTDVPTPFRRRHGRRRSGRPGELGALPVVIDGRQHLVVHEPADPFPDGVLAGVGCSPILKKSVPPHWPRLRIGLSRPLAQARRRRCRARRRAGPGRVRPDAPGRRPGRRTARRARRRSPATSCPRGTSAARSHAFGSGGCPCRSGSWRGDRASIQEITDAAAIGFGSFYNHFESKEQLFQTASQEVSSGGGDDRSRLRGDQ
jgi:hypothetical protein